MNRNTIINKSFTRAFLGYDAAEVDSFLDDVIREFDTMRHELDVARLRNKMLLDELDRFRRQAKEAADAEADNEAAKAENAEPDAAEEAGAAEETDAACAEQADEHTEENRAAEEGMDILRIDGYDDERFDKDVLEQHGAFLIDGKYPCQFRINGADSATVYWHGEGDIDAIIDEFRFYAEHITKFYNENGELIKEFPDAVLFDVDIDAIQPSQFYVSTEKIAAVATFINSGDDIIVPVLQAEESGKYISLDGHTRLYYAYKQGFTKVKAVLSDENELTRDFAREAQARGIYKISDMIEVEQAEYVDKWYKFCDEYIAQKSAGQDDGAAEDKE